MIPSIHLLRCSHCDLYHIAAMPERNQPNKQKYWTKEVCHSQNTQKSFSGWRKGTGTTTKVIIVTTQFSVQSHSLAHKKEGNDRRSKKGERGEKQRNECFNLGAVPVQRQAPYQRWMASPLLLLWAL